MCLYVLCSLYAPIHQSKFQVGVNLLGNKYNSDSDSHSDSKHGHVFLRHCGQACIQSRQTQVNERKKRVVTLRCRTKTSQWFISLGTVTTYREEVDEWPRVTKKQQKHSAKASIPSTFTQHSTNNTFIMLSLFYYVWWFCVDIHIQYVCIFVLCWPFLCVCECVCVCACNNVKTDWSLLSVVHDSMYMHAFVCKRERKYGNLSVWIVPFLLI